MARVLDFRVRARRKVKMAIAKGQDSEIKGWMGKNSGNRRKYGVGREERNLTRGKVGKRYFHCWTCSAYAWSINCFSVNKLHCLTGSRTILHYLGVWGLRLGYLATFGTKSDVIFLLSDPDFL